MLSEVVARIRSHDREAYGELFHMLAPTALNAAFRVVRDRHAAEDVVQETFVTVFRKIDTLANADSFRSWFFAILMNRCREHRRLSAKQSGSIPNVASTADVVQQDMGISEAMERFLEDLSGLDQEIFRGVILERRSYEEVAREQEVTLDVVRTRVYRMRKRFCQEWRQVRRDRS